MRASRNLLRASVAGAILVSSGLVAALLGPSLIASAASPAFPVMCNVGATVTFSPPLTKTGVVSGNSAAVESVTIGSGTLSNCVSADPSGAPSSGSIPPVTFTTPATKLIGDKVNKVQQYAIGYCPGFASTSTFKSLKGLSVTVNWTGGQGGSSTFTDKSPSAAINSFSEVGFTFLGKEGGGSYAQKALNQITAYIDATDSTALATGCSANQTVSSVTIDPATSAAVL